MRPLDITVEITEHAESSRTAEEAAARCGCDVAQIVKSLIFQEVQSGKPVLLLVSGANRVNQAAVAETIGDTLMRPDAGYVREKTGYAIGGIPPLGHAQSLPTYVDEDLLTFPVVWAAAGTPNAVFPTAPADLVEAAGAQVINVTGKPHR